MTSLAEFDALTTPTQAISPSEIVRFNAGLFAAKINPVTGHLTDVLGGSVLANVAEGLLDTSSMKGLHWVMRRGVLDGDPTYVDLCLLACEAIMSYRNKETPDLGKWITTPEELPDGAFPAESLGRSKKVYSMHHKTIVLEKITQVLLLLIDSPMYVGREARVAALLVQIEEFVEYLMTFSGDHMNRFTDQAGAGNQILSIVAFLQEAGVLLGRSDLEDEARTQFEKLITGIGSGGKPMAAKMSFSGDDTMMFVEEKRNKDGIGFDGSYNSFSMELTVNYYLALPNGAWKTQVLGYIAQMLEKCKDTTDIGPLSAEIDTTGWTRVKETPPRSPNNVLFNYCSFAFHVRYAAYVTGTDEGLSDKIMAVGQALGHDGEEIEPLNVPLLIYNALIAQSKLMVEDFGLPTSWPNRNFSPPSDGSPYLEIMVLPNRNTRMFLEDGAESYRQGILQVNYYSANNKGGEAAVTVGSDVSEFFPEGLVLDNEGVRVRITKEPDVGDGIRDPTNARWLTPVSVSYEAIA